MPREHDFKIPEGPPVNYDPENPYADRLAFLEMKEYLVRRKMVEMEKVKIIRKRMRECYQREGVNHIQNCKELAEKFGQRGTVCLFSVLVEDLDIRDGSASEAALSWKLDIFKVLLSPQRRPPDYASAFAQALLVSEHYKESYLGSLSAALFLDFETQLELALALAQTSNSPWTSQGLAFLKEKLLEVDSADLSISESLLHQLLTFIDAHSTNFVDYEPFVHHLREKASEISDDNSTLLPFQIKTETQLPKMTSPVEENYSLAGLLEEIGYTATSSEQVFRGILEKFRITEPAVAEMLGKMIRTHAGLNEHVGDSVNKGILEMIFGSSIHPPAKTTSGWDFDLVVEVLKSAHPDLNWFVIANAFDYDDFYVPDFEAFQLLMQCFRSAVQEHFPLETVIGRVWRNTEGQLSFLRYAVQAPPEVFTFEHARKQMPRLDGIQNGKTPFGTPNHAWLCYDLVKTLCTLGETPKLTDIVMDIISSPLKHCQEVLLVVMATVSSDWGRIQREVIEKLLPVFIASNPNTFVVLNRIWPSCKEKITDFLVRLYDADQSIISRILDICQELKSLTYLLNEVPPMMAVDMATLAARREYLNLDKWLKDKISTDGLSFVEALVKFLDIKLDTMTTESSNQNNIPINIMDHYLRVLRTNSSIHPPDLAESVKQVEIKASSKYPASVLSIPQTEQTEVFSSDIEEEANIYFHQIYSKNTSVEDVIEMLKRYKVSSIQREQEVFACMVHNLFDEYRFFPNYPEEALDITAVLFGQLIHHQLVSSITLGIALRYVLNALTKPGDEKMFKFGLTAINQFKPDLPGWPQYCNHVLQIAAVRDTDPELVAYIEAALVNKAGQTGDHRPADPVGLDPVPDVRDSGRADHSVLDEAGPQASSSLAPRPSGSNATVLESASEMFSNFPHAPENVKDKVAFIFNNLSATNLEAKVAQLRDMVPPEYDQWLANYVVVKRAAQESNFQHLYISLLDKIGNKRLLEHIVQFTYQYIKILLDNDQIKSEMSNRSLLKNLGSWLGQLTLAKNKPVRQKDLDLKSIIYEAYEKGKMVAVIPFVHKVLEQCRESKVYGPDNPWIKGILTLLAEIYKLDGLKMNISFEIEMIFKDFEIPLESIEPMKSLDALERELEGNPDFYDQAHPAAQQSQVAMHYGMGDAAYRKGTHQLPLEHPPSMDTQPPHMHQQNPQLIGLQRAMEQGLEMPPIPPRASFQTPNFPAMPTPGTPGQGLSMQPLDNTTISQMTATLHQLVSINPQLAAIAERFPLKKYVAVAIDRAICEIITPVVERSVMIACTTTKELVTKDFAMEPDEKKLRQAAHLMVSSLAGSLALVTCKEPLKVSLFNHLKNGLAQTLDPTLIEPTVTMVITDNLDLGCTIIEKASIDKAVKEVDERLLPYHQCRQKARASANPFYDMSIFNKGSRFPAALPESLRPRPNYITLEMTRVYDDFTRIPHSSRQIPRMEPQQSHMDPTQFPDQMVAMYKPTTLAERLSLWQTKLDAVLQKENTSLSVVDMSDNAEVAGLVTELVEIVNMTQKRDDVAISLAEKFFILLYERTSNLSCSILCSGLNAIKNSGYPRLPSHLTNWYCHLCQNEARRFNRVVISSLVRAQLISYPELDIFLTGCLTNRAGPLLGSADFIEHLISQHMIGERNLKASDLYNTLDIFRKLALANPASEKYATLVDDARKLVRDADPDGLREQVAPMFDNWAKMVHDDPTEKTIAAGVEMFTKAGFLKGDDVTNRLFRICVELSVLHCVNTEVHTSQGIKAGDGRVSFVMIDAFVKLVVTLKDRIENTDEIQGLKRVLETIVLVLYRDHDDRTSHFSSRPYYRIFVGLFSELLPEGEDSLESFDVLSTLASALISCRPQRVPGFTFSWTELMSHRSFMPRLLKYPERKGWPFFRALFMSILMFMQPYLRNGQLVETLRVLYKGLLRLMLVLLHDFPEFYCEYHVELCNTIPPSCVQMRNLVLSASPSHVLLPDPFTLSINIDLLPNINVEPRMLTDVGQLLPEDLKTGIEEFVNTGTPSTFLDTIIRRLILPVEAQKIEGTTYNMTYMNCLVLYTGMVALSDEGSSANAMAIYKKIANDMDTEGRYLFLNGIANQLRYPNSHTQYFSKLLLTLFAEAETRVLQEQITRVMLERLIVHKPHPWGLFITFIELIKNTDYKFWQLGITAAAPEIEHLFEAVAKSFLPNLQEVLGTEENSQAT